ncbi:hypothetical protein [Nocardioides panaciterrulae]|uniref:Lipoprotein n=1 Tax=Nocardioides panaciterrulae TaxID=661492 RepID=A0A7Y9E5D9_9ACTN|nr:hypothetical protein [Nocardioides panaciterrulae]NYD41225.1 hypothetical protein [Nocardioides panaciterrulae]
MSDPRRRLLAPTVLMLLAGLATGCTSDGGDAQPAARPPSSSASSPASPAPRPVRTRVSVVNVVGKLPAPARQRVQRHVGKVVDGWFSAAYVGGDYPRRDFSDAFPGFTAGARAEAHRDRALMTNQPLGQRIDAVTPTQKLVWLDVLAPRHHAAAVTARFRLAFSTSGHARRHVEVRGRLFLTPGPHGWQVFGYDVAKGTPTELARKKSREKSRGHDRTPGGEHGGKHQDKHQGKKPRHHAKGDGR